MNYELQSTEIDQFAQAMCKAQGEISAARKDSKNPFFKSNYADLGSVTEAIRETAVKNDLAYTQTNIPDDSGIVVVTTIMHKSGQWVRGFLRLPAVKQDPQQYGSAITYGRRYALAAGFGVVQEDDDGNAASKQPPKQHTPKTENGSEEHKAIYAGYYSQIQKAKTVSEVHTIQIKAESDKTWNKWPENWQNNIAGIAKEIENKLAGTEPFK